MAIAIQFELRGTAIDKYYELNESTGFLPDGPMPPRGLFRWVTKIDDGFRTIDLWQSRGNFEHFFNERVRSRYEDVGITDSLEVQVFEVHNYLAGIRRP